MQSNILVQGLTLYPQTGPVESVPFPAIFVADPDEPPFLDPVPGEPEQDDFITPPWEPDNDDDLDDPDHTFFDDDDDYTDDLESFDGE